MDVINAVLLTSGPDKPAVTRVLAEAYGLKFAPTSLIAHINALTNDYH